MNFPFTLPTRHLALCLAPAILVGCTTPAPPQVAPPPTKPVERAAPAVHGTAIIESIRFLSLESFPVRGFAYVTGYLPDTATKVSDVSTTKADERFEILVKTVRPGDSVASTELVPFERRVDLDLAGLPAGTYTLASGGKSATFVLERDNVSP